MLGLLSGFSFAIVYAVLDISVARFADRGDRRTVITAALVVFSAATALCGLGQNFWQLAAALFGVGAGEAGALPPVQSLIADYVPPEKRAGALSVFMVSATVGGKTVMATFRVLAAKPAFVNLTIGLTCYFFYAYGAAIFFPSYMVRVLGIDLKTVGAGFGAISAILSVIGTIGVGFLEDRLVRRDVRWSAHLPAVGLIVALPFAEAAFQVGFTGYPACGFLSGLATGGSLPPVVATIQLVCGPARQAMAVAIIFFFANLIGLGLGPLATGALSDHFSATHGPVGLRYALMIVTVSLLPTAWFMWRPGTLLPGDREA